MQHEVYHSEALAWMRKQPTGVYNLVIGSPPYEDARDYGLGCRFREQNWVDWFIPYVHAALRVSNGLVVFIVNGRTRKFSWSGTPILLMADLIRTGVTLRKPPVFVRNGVPGSGGPDWWKDNYEFCICCTEGGKLPWSENCATGHVPKYERGGACTNRKRDGTRVTGNGFPDRGYAKPKERKFFREDKEDGTVKGSHDREICTGLANPGNIIQCKVGGGHMGSPLAHENEAPFPESLVEPFVRCFCPPGGTVYDPFCGSGTVAAVCEKWGRNSVGTEIRESQVDLTERRILEAREKAAPTPCRQNCPS